MLEKHPRKSSLLFFTLPYYDCFTALLTAFGTRNYFFYTYQKIYLSRKVHDLVRMRNALIENTTILLEIENTNWK